MTFAHLLDNLIQDTLALSLPAFGSELVVCATIILLLLGRLFGTDRLIAPRWIACGGAGLAFLLALLDLPETFSSGRSPAERELLFSGLLINDPLSVFMRALLTGFLFLTTWLTAVSGIPDQEDGPDFHVLLFGSLLGALLMAKSNHLLMLFLSIEMASVPGYILVGFQKGLRSSGEAALKYLVFGAGAAGILLYGSSLLAGSLGTALFPEMAARMPLIFDNASAAFAEPLNRTVVLGALFVFAGLAFKLALVPFHFWCPDAFTGASAEIAGFLSVAPKAAALALLIRFLLSLFGAQTIAILELQYAFGIGLAVIAAMTMTLGNLAAFGQSNIKRLFAYSTIAHAGYLLMGIAAWMVGGNETGLLGIEGVLYYLVVYVFMNLGAFGIVALFRNMIFRETIDDLAGLGRQLPILSAAMVICCVSLIGIWPAGGFIGKFMVFAATMEAGWASPLMWALLGIAIINTLWSVFYYVRVIRAMYQQGNTVAQPSESTRASRGARAFAITITVAILLLGVYVEPVSQAASFVARSLLP